MKECKKCNETKSLTDFHMTRKYYQSICKLCKGQYDKERSKRLSVEISAKKKEYRLKMSPEQKQLINSSRKRIEVSCSECKKKINKRKDSLSKWGGRCQDCARKHFSPTDEHREIMRLCGLNYIKKYGRVPLPKMENRPRGETHWHWGLSITGSDAPNWRGGLTTLNDRLRHSKRYRDWRTAVFERDGYTCVVCSDNTGGNLNADHIKPWAIYKNLRFDVDNGRTLCVKCHRKYGAKVGSNGAIISEAKMVSH